MLPSARSGSDRSSPVNNSVNVPMDDILQPSTSVPQTPKTPKSKSKLLNSLTKSIGSKTPPRMGLMRSPSSSKQPPAMNMPSGEVHSGDTLENYVLPHSLRMDTVDVNAAAQGGMEVIKVSKVSVLYCCLTEVMFVKCVYLRLNLCCIVPHTNVSYSSIFLFSIHSF